MPIASISLKITQDVNDNPIRLDYDLVNLGVRVWFALFINDQKIYRFRTNNSGNLTGFQDSISALSNSLLALGGFSTIWTDSNNMPSSGTIAGTIIEVEDTFNDGIEEFPNIGTWTIEMRYD